MVSWYKWEVGMIVRLVRVGGWCESAVGMSGMLI